MNISSSLFGSLFSGVEELIEATVDTASEQVKVSQDVKVSSVLGELTDTSLISSILNLDVDAIASLKKQAGNQDNP